MSLLRLEYPPSSDTSLECKILILFNANVNISVFRGREVYRRTQGLYDISLVEMVDAIEAIY